MIGGHLATSSAFDAVVRLGDCTGVVVEADLVLTSAHCVPVPVDHVVIGGHSVPLAGCRAYPGYQPLEWANDIGVCRLAKPSPVAPIPVDGGPSPAQGNPVVLAGRGLTQPFAKGEGALRVVDTSVTGARAEGIYVGTSQRTACRGDSGGAVLVERDGVLRVAAILHGGSGAICASAAEAVLVRPYLAWIGEGARAREAASHHRALVGAVAVMALVLLGARMWARMRSRRAGPMRPAV